MKKKIALLLVFLLCCVFGIYGVNARECKYNYSGKEISLTFDEDQNTGLVSLKSCTVDGQDCSQDNVSGYDKIYNFVDGSLITSNDQCYGSLNVCTLTVRDMPIGTSILSGVITVIANEKSKEKYLGIFGASLDTLTIDDAYANAFDANNKSFWDKVFWTGRGITCTQVDYSGEKLDLKNMIYSCNKFSELFSNISDSYRKYEACGEVAGINSEKAKISKCRAKALSDVNKATDTLRNTCNNIMQNQSYSVEDGCVASCINAVKSIEVLKENYIGLENFNNDCSFSNRLIIWISNIVRWIKYIIPVAVIVLGIIDFIKAIAADKDDEMKKAQGRFIRRLIAAALIFIVPFILEFILDKLGFGYNGCGIIDL